MTDWGTAMHVEIAGPSDIDALAQLNQHVQALHLHAAPSHFKETTLEEVAEAYRDFLHQDGARGFIAFGGGRAVGYVLSVIRHRPENAFCPARSLVYVDQISVDPGYQGQGVGRGLMEAVIRYAKESGIDDIEVETWAFNTAAQGFFRSLGFEPRTIRFRMSRSMERHP